MLFKERGRLVRHAEQEGHGLGLMIARQMIERMGGHVGVTSEVGVGSVFSFALRKA